MIWRGAMLDISRHFFDKEFIKKTISALAIFDYNILHLHLTDDQGWRLESKKFPKLHEIGSIRKQSQINHGTLPPEFDGIKHSGYLTHEDVREIVLHAKVHGITIVPEINIPGHTRALLAAYPQYGVNQRNLEVGEIWGIADSLLTPFDETFEFLAEIFTEVASVFPSDYIHVGGDESLIAHWLDDPQVVSFMNEKGFASPKDLFMYFMGRIEEILTPLNKKMITWDDAFAFDPEKATDATVMSWRGAEIAALAVAHGKEVIQGPVIPTYFDYYQADDASEPLAIGGPITLDDVLEFTPIKGILGVQFQLWSEYIATPAHAEYMMWPRAAALAYRCWGEAQSFENYYSSRLPQLEALGVKHRSMDAATRIGSKELGTASFFKGHDVHAMMHELEESAAKGEVAFENLKDK